jgi:error-prone DNA polymerase
MDASADRVDFAELGAFTNYSFLEGASFPEEMVEVAAAYRYRALAVCDRNGFYGSVRTHVAAAKKGLPLVHGTTLAVTALAPMQHPVLLAKNRAGYGDLCQLVTRAHQHSRERPESTWEDVLGVASHTFCLVPVDATAPWPELRAAFGDRLFGLVTGRNDGADQRRWWRAETFERSHSVPVLFSQRPLFHSPARKPLQDLLTAIRHATPLSELGFRALSNGEGATCRLPEALYRWLGPERRHWLTATVDVASRCAFSLDELKYRYPTEWIPEGETNDSYLEKLVWQCARERYGDRVPEKIATLVRRELALIAELGYADYFLTVWDIVQYARSRNILCQGRGSAANSAVCFVLGITAVDPEKLDVLFERFISRERAEPPDIDIDFEHERREEVIQYLYRRYGRERSAISAEVICFRRKSSLREAAKAFGYPPTFVKAVQTLTFRRSLDTVGDDEIQSAATRTGVRTSPLLVRRFFALVKELHGFPRHLGTHVGGFVLSQERLDRLVPLEPAAMEGRTIVQWDKNDLDALGMVRVDILGLGILTAIGKTFADVARVYGDRLTLATLPPEDREVYAMACRADTVGVFQLESRAQMNMLPRLRPCCFYDLVIEISLVRPGPIQGDMVHPYLRRRSGLEPVEFDHPDLEPILRKTCGVPLFQEQILKMAMAVAGFTPGEADELRRAMGSWRRDGGHLLEKMGERFRRGLVAKGVPASAAERIFAQIAGFAEYGFPESHAASFSVLVYATLYLKRYYPDAFVVGLLNSQPMGFYASHSLVADAQRHGVTFAPTCVNASDWDNRVDEVRRVRLGLREIAGLREEFGRAIEAERRENGPFQSLRQLVERVRERVPPTRRDVLLLAQSNALATLVANRREALWEAQAVDLKLSALEPTQETPTELPEETPWERVALDYEAQGLSLWAHPMALLRADLDGRGILSSQGLRFREDGAAVAVAGLVICRQMPPTAGGVFFLTLEDEFGFANLVVWNDVFEKYRDVLLNETLLLVHGRLQRVETGNARGGKSGKPRRGSPNEKPLLHVVAATVEPLRRVAPEATLAFESNDFR